MVFTQEGVTEPILGRRYENLVELTLYIFSILFTISLLGAPRDSNLYGQTRGKTDNMSRPPSFNLKCLPPKHPTYGPLFKILTR